MEEKKNMHVIATASLTKRGFVSLWESGGSGCNTGEATIICRPNGGMPTAVYICRRGHLSNDAHALVPVHPGFFVIKSSHHRRDFNHEIYRVIRTFTEGDNAKVELSLVNKYDQGEWDQNLPSFLEDAVAAAEAKATEYHCRTPFYVVEKEKKE